MTSGAVLGPPGAGMAWSRPAPVLSSLIPESAPGAAPVHSQVGRAPSAAERVTVPFTLMPVPMPIAICSALRALSRLCAM